MHVQITLQKQQKPLRIITVSIRFTIQKYFLAGHQIQIGELRSRRDRRYNIELDEIMSFLTS